MATVKKHVSKAGKITYYIRTYDGYDSKGNQIERSMTWKPPENMTQKHIEKELQRQVVMFEESVKKGTCFDSNTRFAEYAETWLENNKPPILAPKTYERYKALLQQFHFRLIIAACRKPMVNIFSCNSRKGFLNKLVESFRRTSFPFA